MIRCIQQFVLDSDGCYSYHFCVSLHFGCGKIDRYVSMTVTELTFHSIFYFHINSCERNISTLYIHDDDL